MQITIVQTEIETAIRNYILSQITVREDQRIDIDLRATRGAEGFQAVIDIRPDRDPEGTKTTQTTESKPAPRKEASPAAKSGPSASVTPSVFRKAEVTTTKVIKAKEEETPANDTAEDVEAKEDTVVPFEPTKKVEAQEAQEAQTAKADEEAKTEEAPRSIFAGLRKPVNQAASA